MIVDFHTHTYPDSLAPKVISSLAGPSGVKAYTDATNLGLIASSEKNGIDKSILLPVVTNPATTDAINRSALEVNEKNGCLLSFGGIHPDNENYRSILKFLVENGFKGIKLHPVFQKTNLDDIRYMRITECACELGLIVSVHAGLDINDASAKYSSVPHMRTLLKTVKPDRIILAHMGGHLCWQTAEDMILEYRSEVPENKCVYLDTAFCLPSPVDSENINYEFLSKEQFVRIVREIGSDHILFGTDSPWTDQGSSLEAIRQTGLTQKEIFRILGENAKDLLLL